MNNGQIVTFAIIGAVLFVVVYAVTTGKLDLPFTLPGNNTPTAGTASASAGEA